jgi:hypothetical protein
MEPIKTTKTARLRRLKMYREDLDELVGLLQKNCASLTISDNKNRYDSLDEMKTTIGPKVKNLDLRSESPCIHFLLNQKESVPGASVPTVFNELRSEEISDQADLLFLKCKDCLQQFERPNMRWPFIVLAFTTFTGAIVLMLRPLLLEGRPPLLTLIFVVVAVILFIAGANVNNLILLDRRIDSPSFWIRNKDAFATHAVTATIGALIGAIVGWFFGHFIK